MNTATETSNPALGFDKLTPFIARLLIIMSIAFTLLPGDFNWDHAHQRSNFAEGSLLFQIKFGSLFLIGAWLAWRNRYWTLRLAQRLNPLLIAMTLYCLSSILWSSYPIVTLKRSVQLIGLILVGITISAPAVGKHQLIRSILYTLMTLMAFSLVVALALPHIGVDHELGGAWRGVLLQKNTLGAISGLCVLFWIKESRDNAFPRPICWFGILFGLFMLIMSKSSTSMLVTMLGAGTYLLARRRYLSVEFGIRRLLLILAIIILCGLHAFYVMQGRLPEWDEWFAPLGALLNKSADLTGRTHIWHMTLLEIQKHPVFGIGYGAFWLGEGSRSHTIIDALRWNPLQAHNGYLDILNELGIVGIVLMSGVFIFHMFSLAQLARIDREEAAIHLSILVLILISNLSESAVFRGVMFQNILFIYSSTAVSAQLMLYRIQWQEMRPLLKGSP
ncbi:MAG: O-antigen ligase family protein [Herbaspirillum sp.]